MEATMSFESFNVVRRTGETRFSLRVSPRQQAACELQLPNRLLAHFMDHFSKATGVQFELLSAEWPGSWQFDHVLCEDLGQLVGRAIRELHDQRLERSGLPGRADVRCAMDDASCGVVLSIEGRPRADWVIPEALCINGFVDSWYDEDRIAGEAYGTNLRQFVDGFVLGLGATLQITVERCNNLHHLYETLFRALGDSVEIALGALAERRRGESSGFAGRASYEIER